MSRTSYQISTPQYVFYSFVFILLFRTDVRRLADMSPTSYQLLHPAICLLLFCFYSTLSNRCPPLGGYEPNGIPTGRPRNMFFILLFLFYSFEPMSAAWRI